jgi:putative transposase
MAATVAPNIDATTAFPIRIARRAIPSPGLRVLAGGNASQERSPTRHHARRGTALMPLLPVAYRGSYLRRLLAPRRPVELALLSVIQETYLAGAGTRTIDALAETVGVAGTTPSEVQARAREWDQRVDAFRQRPLRDIYPYLMLVETPVLVRVTAGAECGHAVVAVGRTAAGVREVVGFDVRTEATPASFWHAFLSDLRARGLANLEVVTSDPLDGLLPALVSVYPGARWQRCREGFVADALRVVAPTARAAVAASLRPIFCQPDAQSALAVVSRVRAQFEFAYPELVEMLEGPVGSLLTYYQVPASQRRGVTSLNALASLQRELRQSCQLVGIFPHRRTLLRLCGAVLQEISDEWAARATPRRRRAMAAAAWEAQVVSASRLVGSAWAAA